MKNSIFRMYLEGGGAGNENAQAASSLIDEDAGFILGYGGFRRTMWTHVHVYVCVQMNIDID